MEKQQTLPDLQNTRDGRGIPINRVGVKDVHFPIKVIRKDKTVVDVQSRVGLYVSLPHDYRGANMSRFSEVLIDHQYEFLAPETILKMVKSLKERMGAVDAWIRFEFDYFLDKAAPVSGKILPQSYRVAFSHSVRDSVDIPLLEVNVVGASVCPCSKEMCTMSNLTGEQLSPIMDDEAVVDGWDLPDSMIKEVGLGAHNQRCNVKMEVVPRGNDFVWIEDLIAIAERQVSVPVYPILKRRDEQYVTIAGYRNPKFVEDIARDVAHELDTMDPSFAGWSVRVESDESIHPHNCDCIIHSPNWSQYK